MPELIHIEKPTFQILVWQVNEPEKELIKIAKLTRNDEQRLFSISNPLRRRVFIATRAILRKLNINDLAYRGDGKPMIANGYISISHTSDKVAVYYSTLREAGVDIEEIAPRIHKIKDRFLNSEEINAVCRDETRQLIICWAVKEAVFKKHGGKTVFFKSNQRILKIDPELKIITVSFIVDDKEVIEDLCYTDSIDNFIIVYTM